ncbi:MAG: 2-isopropylmalate synthase [Clostridiales bacterium]|nr:2-isopropylmalate synthase [Clostridiales bacterium]
MNYHRYRPFAPIGLKDRTWCDKVITEAPIWCSVDLRDGNQALVPPMNLDQKINFFKHLVKIGFKEIEIGFPAASDTEFAFCRALIEQNLIPDDVTIQVLTQSREHIIRRTFEALEGCPNPSIVHLYNSTSTLQRDVVFGKSKEEIKELAVFGANLLEDLANEYGREKFRFEYSPESFTGTEVDYACEVCNAVLDVWKPTPDRKVIINLPSTVEMATPNIYADQIEYCCRNLKYRDNVIVSLHAHNDRGEGIAATELGLMAGADRVEGTLFGNGERTGNCDIMVVALNMFTQGVDPKLDFSNITDSIDIYEKSTGMRIDPRHPYVGDLVYTAFSGSHQDAIKKGMKRLEEHPDRWEVPYLPIDPADVGRNYDPIIRINSQSGKGGVSYILEHNYGLSVPKSMQQAFSLIITGESDRQNRELNFKEIFDLFFTTYDVRTPLSLKYYYESGSGNTVTIRSDLLINGEFATIEGSGNGVIDAFCDSIKKKFGVSFEIVTYSQHSLDYGNKSRAITYIEVHNCRKETYYGIGISVNTAKSSFRAILSALNQFIKIKNYQS